MEYEVYTLDNGIKVINLMAEAIEFEDGTIVPAQFVSMKIRSMRRRSDITEEQVKAVLGEKSQDVKFSKKIELPDVDALWELKRSLPKGCLYLTKTHVAEVWGFPFVSPAFKHLNEQGKPVNHIGLFLAQ